MAPPRKQVKANGEGKVDLSLEKQLNSRDSEIVVPATAPLATASSNPSNISASNYRVPETPHRENSSRGDSILDLLDGESTTTPTLPPPPAPHKDKGNHMPSDLDREPHLESSPAQQTDITKAKKISTVKKEPQGDLYKLLYKDLYKTLYEKVANAVYLELETRILEKQKGGFNQLREEVKSLQQENTKLQSKIRELGFLLVNIQAQA